MKKTFIVATTGDRLDGATKLILSLYKFLSNGWRMVIVAQGYSPEALRELKSTLGDYGTIVALDKLIGPHSAKVIALNKVKSDVWCSLDDDMFATKNTNYDRIAELLMEDKSIGFISGNWARTIELAQKKKVDDTLIKQKLVYTGGGLLFRDDVAEIIRNIPNEQYLFDDCLWAMYAYINGYMNYKYYGSITIHRICTKGGRKTWIKQLNDRILPPPQYLIARESDDAEGYLICMDRDLTPLAHEMHKANKKHA